ncbi:MAG: hypothetical protein Q8936_20295 [Bacillota bacterium]|nr:hypothetical protein [Bacillota bacterium]
MRIKKTLSIQGDVLEKAQRKADEMFSGNFSIYITYLINKDLQGITEIKKSEESIHKHSSEVSCAISQILGD